MPTTRQAIFKHFMLEPFIREYSAVLSLEILWYKQTTFAQDSRVRNGAEILIFACISDDYGLNIFYVPPNSQAN